MGQLNFDPQSLYSRSHWPIFGLPCCGP